MMKDALFIQSYMINEMSDELLSMTFKSHPKSLKHVYLG